MATDNLGHLESGFLDVDVFMFRPAVELTVPPNASEQKTKSG